MRSRRFVGISLFLGVFLLYLFTFSSVPTADGTWYISNIDRGDYQWILLSHSPLTGYFFFSLKGVLSALGLQVVTLTLIQTVNAAVAALETVLLYNVIQLVGGGSILGVLGGALFATSFGSWYFANGEYQHLSLGVLLVILYLLLRARLTEKLYGYGFIVGLALLNSIAVLFRQENFLFGLAVVAMLMVGRPWSQGVKEGLVYTLAGSIGTLVLVLAVGVYLRGLSTPQEFARWYFWIFDYVRGPQEYHEFEYAGLPFVGPRVVKGQLTAFVFGTQIVVDALRRHVLLGYPKVVALLGLTLFTYAVMLGVVLDLWRARGLIRGRCLILLIGCAVWLISYKVLIHSWFWPTSTKYHVVTLPPLVLLLLLGPIARRGTTRLTLPRPLVGTGAVAILLLLVVAINFWAGILPWYEYGRMKEALAVQRETTFRRDDFFISSESGIDAVFRKNGRYISVKGLFGRVSKKEGFEFIRVAIDEQLRSGGRVFLYNFVPSPFTLIGLNQTARGSSERFAPEDFEAFLTDLRARYALRPVLSYWEEGKAPLYLYGGHLETLWEVVLGPAR